MTTTAARKTELSHEKVSLSDAKTNLSEIVNKVITGASRAVEIIRHNRPAAVIVGVETYQRFQAMEDAVVKAELRRALRGKKRPLRQIIKELGLDV